MENRKNFTLRKADAPTHRRIFIYTIGHSAVKSPTSRKPPLQDAMAMWSEKAFSFQLVTKIQGAFQLAGSAQ